jgi:hypothetical protein
MVAYAAAADFVRCCCSMEEVWAAEKNFNLCVERIFEGWYGASQCGPLNNALNPTLGLKNSFF